MDLDTTERCHIILSKHGIDVIAIAQRIAKHFDISNKWIILHGNAMTAAGVARRIRALLHTDFQNCKPRGVCVADGPKAYVHWDRDGVFGAGSTLP